jgi:hypothetical protein
MVEQAPLSQVAHLRAFDAGCRENAHSARISGVPVLLDERRIAAIDVIVAQLSKLFLVDELFDVYVIPAANEIG